MRRVFICMALLMASGARGADDGLLVRLNEEIAGIVERASPAVVSVRVENPIASGAQMQVGPNVSTYVKGQVNQALTRVRQYPGVALGRGSGFLISPDGYVVTASYVVERAQAIKVVLPGERTLPARLLGTDPASGVALLKVEGKGLPALSLGDSDTARPGNWAIAIGNWPGLENSVSVGVIAGRDRWLGLGSLTQPLLQLTGTIAPGTGGGPVLDARGQVIGITAVAMRSPGSAYILRSRPAGPDGRALDQQSQASNVQVSVQSNAVAIDVAPPLTGGVGFAIPINSVKAALEDLKAGRTPQRTYLGVQVQAVRAQDAQAGEGALVAQVIADSPAARAGLQKGDVLLEFAGSPIRTPGDLLRAVKERRPGDRVALTYRRGAEKRTVTVVLGQVPAPAKR